MTQELRRMDQACDLKPGQRFRWYGYLCEVERQAANTTLAWIVEGHFRGVHFRIKKRAKVEPL